jgi:hypothetical protein
MRAILCTDFAKLRNAEHNFVQIPVTEYSTNQVIDTLQSPTLSCGALYKV